MRVHTPDAARAIDGLCEADGTLRARLVESGLAVVEGLRGCGVRLRRSPERFSADFQVCLPYRGCFVWHVAGSAVVGHANQALFVSGGESFYLSQPVAADYAELIITPDVDLLAELAPGSRSLTLHPLFRRRSRRVDHALQHLRAFFTTHGAASGIRWSRKSG